MLEEHSRCTSKSGRKSLLHHNVPGIQIDIIIEALEKAVILNFFRQNRGITKYIEANSVLFSPFVSQHFRSVVDGRLLHKERHAPRHVAPDEASINQKNFSAKRKQNYLLENSIALRWWRQFRGSHHIVKVRQGRTKCRHRGGYLVSLVSRADILVGTPLGHSMESKE